MSQDWWSRKLTGAPAPKPAPPAPAPPSYGANLQPMPNPYNSPPTQVAPKKTTYEKNQGTCPECGSDNYYVGTTSRCYDCGYPVVQQGSGIGATGGEGPAKAARQVPSQGFQPTNIQGRIG